MTDRYRCEWCGYTHPVATMVSDHRERCEVNPRGAASVQRPRMPKPAA